MRGKNKKKSFPKSFKKIVIFFWPDFLRPKSGIGKLLPIFSRQNFDPAHPLRQSNFSLVQKPFFFYSHCRFPEWRRRKYIQFKWKEIHFVIHFITWSAQQVDKGQLTINQTNFDTVKKTF